MKIFTQMVVQWVESVKKHDKNKQQLHQHPIHELPITAGLSESQPINVDGFPYKRSRHRRLGSISEISTISSLEATHHAYTHTHTLHWLRLHTDHPSMVMVLIFRDRQNSATQKNKKISTPSTPYENTDPLTICVPMSGIDSPRWHGPCNPTPYIQFQ